MVTAVVPRATMALPASRQRYQYQRNLLALPNVA